MDEIRLPGGLWRVDFSRPLGKAGGFGEVFVGESADGRAVAIKRLKLTAEAAAHRELAIADELASLGSEHVVPVLDSGQDADSDRYYIVMPIAEGNLQEYLDAQGPLEPSEAASIIGEIATGLADAAAIVHRDLKPHNILRLDSRWQIADFGIARFAEESTSLETLKAALTPAYAAPEQWRLEHATAATDVYALGCVAYQLLSGSPPFGGSIEELQEQHLKQTPSPLKAPSRLRSLVSMMLRKEPQARPNISRIRAIVARAEDEQAVAVRGLEGLTGAAARHAEMEAAVEAEREAARSASQARQALAEEARVILSQCFEELSDRIVESVPGASKHQSSGTHVVRVAGAELEMNIGSGVLSADAFPRSGWDVLCGASIGVAEPGGHQRSASLWYTRQKSPNSDPRWYEVGYRGNIVAGRRFEYEPTGTTPELADRAHSNAMDVVTTCYPPTAIDDEDLEAFCARWIYILAEAAEGRLSRLPQSLPDVGE